MPVIALIGNKGGAGKTTLCVNLAAGMASGHPSVILDADPQQSSLQWCDIAECNQAVDVVDASDNIEHALNALDERYVNRLIDCPPSVHSDQMQQALLVADIAVIPVQPSPLDIWATVHIEAAVEIARQDNPKLKAILVINQFESRTRLSKIMQRALAELSVPAAETIIKRRAVYRNSFLEGKTVHDMGSRGAAASDEIRNLIREVEEWI